MGYYVVKFISDFLTFQENITTDERVLGLEELDKSENRNDNTTQLAYCFSQYIKITYQ